MPRYFLELAYKGTNYSGFQIQANARSVQQEVEKALAVFLRSNVGLTGSSRTDGGVHAIQNFFHFDYQHNIDQKSLYNLNAILPPDIGVKGLYPVAPDAHCRFDALSREYRYYIYREKNPFLADRAYFFPYTLDRQRLDAAAAWCPNSGNLPRSQSGIRSRRSMIAGSRKAFGRRKGTAWYTGLSRIVFCVAWY